MGFFKSFVAASLVAGVSAQTKITFQSQGIQIVGHHWAPSSTAPAPGIVIAHGLGGLQSSRLQPYAERFSAAGYHAITFDYRYWGESDGIPRNLIDTQRQQQDYEAAIVALQGLSGVDASRIGIWGTSLSGGTVLELAPKHPNLTVVITQCPHVNGLATVGQLPAESLPGLLGAGLDDLTRSVLLQSPNYIPLANETGEFGALTQAGAAAGYRFIQPNPPEPGNVFPARFVLELPFFSPDVTAAASHIPTFIGVGLTDNIVSPNATLALAARMPNVTLEQYPNTGHFDVYPGKATYEENVSKQLDFLKKYMPV